MTAWSRYDNRWRGVRVSDLLDLVRPETAARFVLLQRGYHNHGDPWTEERYS